MKIHEATSGANTVDRRESAGLLSVVGDGEVAVSEPVDAPTTDGVKATCTVQLDPAASVPVQVDCARLKPDVKENCGVETL